MGDRCTGHCCRLFPVSSTITEIEKVTHAEGGSIEAEKLLVMLRFEGLTDVGLVNGEPLGRTMPVYSCIHLKPDGDCGNYEDRPKMCRDYPYEGGCRDPDCTWDGARADGQLRVVA